MISTKEFDDEFDYKEYTNLCRAIGLFAKSKFNNDWRQHFESLNKMGESK